MIVDVISKVSLDGGSIPPTSTSPVCKKRSKKAVRFTCTKDEVSKPAYCYLGVHGFDSLQVWIKEIVAATITGKSVQMFPQLSRKAA
jgi:hypothetical protein